MSTIESIKNAEAERDYSNRRSVLGLQKRLLELETRIEKLERERRAAIVERAIGTKRRSAR
jgi:hypothetical protein